MHELRHTAATLLRVAGHGAGQVAKRLSHSSARVAQSLCEPLYQGEQTAMGGPEGVRKIEGERGNGTAFLDPQNAEEQGGTERDDLKCGEMRGWGVKDDLEP